MVPKMWFTLGGRDQEPLPMHCPFQDHDSPLRICQWDAGRITCVHVSCWRLPGLWLKPPQVIGKGAWLTAWESGLGLRTSTHVARERSSTEHIEVTRNRGISVRRKKHISYIYINININIHIDIDIDIEIYFAIYHYFYIYIYMYIYFYIYIYIYIYFFRSLYNIIYI